MSTTYIKSEKPKAASTILADINQRISVKKESLFLVGVILDVSKKWDGKKITKRFCNDVQKALEGTGYKAYYDTRYGMFHIDIDYLSAPNKFTSLIAYASDPVVYLTQVKGYNRCHTLDEERIERLECGKPNVPELVDRWNAAIAELQAINKQAAAYELEYTFEVGRDTK